MSDQDDRTDIAARWRRLAAASGAGGHEAASVKERLAAEKRQQKKVDGRTLRRTGRTHQFNVRVKQETKDAIQRIAASHHWLIGEVIEQAVAVLEAQLMAHPRGDDAQET